MALQNIKRDHKRLKVIFGDSAYKQSGLPDWVEKGLDCILQPVFRPVGVKDFAVLLKRWIIERTFAWPNEFRRHGKDFE